MKTNKEQYKSLKKYIKRLCIIYLFWTIYNSLLLNFRNGIPKNPLILFQYFILGKDNGYLWFISALIFSVLLVYCLMKYLDINKVVLVSILFYIVALFLQPYYNVINSISAIKELQEFYYSIFGSIRNGLFTGFIFVSLGSYIVNQQIIFKKSKYICRLVISIILMFFEMFIIKEFKLNEYGLAISIFLVPSTYYLMIICSNITLKVKLNYRFLRQSSVIMFLIGQTYIRGLDFLARKLQIGLLMNSFIFFISVVCLSIISSIIIINISKNKYFKWIKLLY